jgi:Kef-type K+ transport system membrane component KefB
MWRTLMPIFTIVLPVTLGMAAVFLFIEDTIGAATAIVVSFAMTAIAITAGLVQLGDDESAKGPESRLR